MRDFGWSRLRLRHKLALSLSLAALLPVVVAASVSVRVVLGGLEAGLAAQTRRQLQVAMNLFLGHVERLGGDAQRLASAPRLVEAMALGGAAVKEFVALEEPHLPSALVWVAAADGRVVASRAVLGPDQRHAPSTPHRELIRRGLAYGRAITLDVVGDRLIVSAVAPIVEPSFTLRGVVLVALPLDGDFADLIKGALGTDVLFHAGAGPAQSSFLDSEGARLSEILPPPGAAAVVLAGGSFSSKTTIADRQVSLGYAPLKDLAGRHVGMLGVAVNRDALTSAQAAAARTLSLGAAVSVLCAMALAGLISRRLTRPIARLHAGALAVARGDLDVDLSSGARSADEISELGAAFATMTGSLRDNQERLAARMRELLALHEASRAVSSVLGLDEVLRKIVDSASRVLDVRLAVLFLHGESDPARRWIQTGEGATSTSGLEALAASVVQTGRTQARGSLLAVPLERKGTIMGALVVGRPVQAPAWGDAAERLIATFADQAATAIENARLYEEVRAASGELEEKVALRTSELTAMNAELGRALNELRDTQAQLIQSERMAGLGALVAGVAHEINSPSAAIRGSVDALADNVRRLAQRARELGEMGLPEGDRTQFLALVEDLASRLAERRVVSPAEVRRKARELSDHLGLLGLAEPEKVGRTLAELSAEDSVDDVVGLLRRLGRFEAEGVLIGYLQEYTYLHRNAAAIQAAIKQIQRIIGALKSYSHLDQAKVELADLHDGIENTLVILHHELKYGINVVRNYGPLPKIPVYVDELNQVWTNLIHNAVQALGEEGDIIIETSPAGPTGGDALVAVRIIDNGPGISPDIMPRIFEPFFTTKAKGEGTGLGLGIVQKIVEKHGGRVDVTSIPGRTCFTVLLPVQRPQVPPA